MLDELLLAVLAYIAKTEARSFIIEATGSEIRILITM